MNVIFAQHVEATAKNFADLIANPLLPMRGGPSHAASPGIYIIYEAGMPAHVGRTRNLRRRLQGHCSHSQHQASFAFKRAREKTGSKADYKAGNSRGALFATEAFRTVFDEEVKAIRQMEYRFLQVDEPLAQYLLELYAALELGTCLDEFDTH